MAEEDSQLDEQKPRRPIGRPTKYKRKFCQEIIEFFDVEPYEEVERKTTDVKSGREYYTYEDRGANLPTIERFAHTIGVNPDTLVEWAKVHPDFSAAYMRAKALQKDLLIINGLLGHYQSNFAQFVAKNLTDMKDKQETDITSGGKPIEPKVISAVAPREDAVPEAETASGN